eukprot:Skav209132  [mRNA]  locus=scaffold682:276847:281425:+ [translate_table: standard]
MAEETVAADEVGACCFCDQNFGAKDKDSRQQADLEKIQEGSDGSSSSDSDSSSSSNSSSFGCQSEEGGKNSKRKKGKQPKAAAKKAKAEKPEKAEKAEAEEKIEKAPKPAEKDKAIDKAGSQRRSKKDQEKSKGLATEGQAKDGAERLLGLLGELGAPAVWRSVVRATEVDRRVSRIGAIQCELQDVCCAMENEAGGPEQLSHEENIRKDYMIKLHQKLESESKRVVALKDLCKFIRSATPDDMANDISTTGSVLENYRNCYTSLQDADGTLVEMIQTIAKKLLDAPDYLFFKFLQMRDSIGQNTAAVTLAAMWRVPPHENRDDSYHLALTKAQHGSMEAFYDKLKGNDAVQWAGKQLFPELRNADFDEPTHWCLDSKTVSIK